LRGPAREGGPIEQDRSRFDLGASPSRTDS